MTWKLRRTRQCAKCPWIVGVDPREIPNGYDVEKHKALKSTIAEPGAFFDAKDVAAMACHETGDSHCIGWLVNQIGDGNNIMLRLRMISCANADRIRLRGEQHRSLEETLPS